MSSLPADIYCNIFCRLPVKSTLVCKYVCKSWFSIISDPDFIRMHLNCSPHRDISKYLLVGGYDYGHKDAIYSVSYDKLEPSLSEKELSLMSICYPHDFSSGYGVELSKMCYPYKSLGYGVELLASYNGLVFLVFFDNDNHGGSDYKLVTGGSDRREELFFCLWNPATHEYKKITKPTNNFSYVNICMCAFGYDHKNDDYKLVIGVDNEHTSLVHVYALGSDSWKSAMTVHYSFCGKPGLLVNGCFHWLAEGRKGNVVVTLDINDEKFEELELPIELNENEHWFLTEGVLEGCLSLLVVDCTDGYPGPFGVWVMQDYGVGESWTKCYDITHGIIYWAILQQDDDCPSLRFVCSFKNGKILLMNLDKLIIYDPKDGSAIERDMGSGRGFRSEVNYFESLVSVYSGTYVRKEQIEESIETEET